MDRALLLVSLLLACALLGAAQEPQPAVPQTQPDVQSQPDVQQETLPDLPPPVHTR